MSYFALTLFPILAIKLRLKMPFFQYEINKGTSVHFLWEILSLCYLRLSIGHFLKYADFLAQGLPPNAIFPQLFFFNIFNQFGVKVSSTRDDEAVKSFSSWQMNA